MWAKLNRFVDAVEVDGKFKYYNEVKQNPNQHYEMIQDLFRNLMKFIRGFLPTLQCMNILEKRWDRTKFA